MRRFAFVVVLVVLCACAQTRASVRIYEPFNFPAGPLHPTEPRGTTSLDGLGGAPLGAWGPVWGQTLYSTHADMYVGGPTLGGPERPHNTYRFSGAGTAVYTDEGSVAFRSFSAPMNMESSRDWYVSFLMRTPPKRAGDNRPYTDLYAGLSFYSFPESLSGNGGQEVFFGMARDRLRIGEVNGSAAAFSEVVGSGLVPDTVYFIVAKIRSANSNNPNDADAGYMVAYGPDDPVPFAAPVSVGPGGWAVSQSGDMIQDSLWFVRIAGNYDFQFDELRIGDTWADVTGVPEPGASCVGLTTAGLLVARRRRKSA
jgi:hypothetical protein